MTDAKTHALASPSGADRWMACVGSIAMSAGIPNRSSSFADEGTAAHELAARTLMSETDSTFLLQEQVAENGYVFTKEMCRYVQEGYVDRVRDQARGNILMVEQELSIEHLTGEKGAKGTSDAVIIADGGDELQVHDLKYGMGVAVIADENKQLMIYGLAAMEEFAVLGPFKRVRLFIHMPRLGYTSEWAVSVEKLLAFAEEVKAQAQLALTLTRKETENNLIFLKPGEKQCKFCPARATCPALAAEVARTTDMDFEDLTPRGDPKVLVETNEELSKKMDRIALVETWCKAIRALVESELFAGRKVGHYKIVQGKKGSRKFADEEKAEALLKAKRILSDQMYNKSLKTAPQLEKELKGEKPKVWAELAAMIVQSEGKPHVAPGSDPRPEWVAPNPDGDFTDLTQTEEGEYA